MLEWFLLPLITLGGPNFALGNFGVTEMSSRVFGLESLTSRTT